MPPTPQSRVTVTATHFRQPIMPIASQEDASAEHPFLYRIGTACRHPPNPEKSVGLMPSRDRPEQLEQAFAEDASSPTTKIADSSCRSRMTRMSPSGRSSQTAAISSAGIPD